MRNGESVQAFDRPLHTGHGGAREGAGRTAYTKSDDQKDLDKQKARHEKVKADLAELEFRERIGQLVSRAAVQQGAATALATLAGALRCIPDNLERKLNLAPEAAELVGRDIDAALNELADTFESLTGDIPIPEAGDAA